MTDEKINARQSVTEVSEPGIAASSQRPTAMSVAVAIPAYTMDRWSLLTKAVESLRIQTVPVDEIVLCIDNNDELLQRAREQWQASEGTDRTSHPQPAQRASQSRGDPRSRSRDKAPLRGRIGAQHSG